MEETVCFDRVEIMSSRFSGPGGLHNIGNLLALFGGLTVYVLTSAPDRNAVLVVQEYFFGDARTAALSLSMIIFLAAGEFYHQAICGNARPDKTRLRLADGLSAVAALIGSYALVSYGNTGVALVAASLLVVAKLGTAIFPQTTRHDSQKLSIPSFFRVMAICSRFPSLAALALTLPIGAGLAAFTPEAAIGLIMFFSYLLWLAADFMLFQLGSGGGGLRDG